MDIILKEFEAKGYKVITNAKKQLKLVKHRDTILFNKQDNLVKFYHSGYNGSTPLEIDCDILELSSRLLMELKQL